LAREGGGFHSEEVGASWKVVACYLKGVWGLL